MLEKDITLDMLLGVYNDLARKMASHRFKALADHLRMHELSLNQYSILSLVERNGACLSIHLAQDLQLKAASITYLVDSLEKRGLVKRVENTEDRRSHFVQLTKEGQEIIPIPEMNSIATDFFEHLNTDDQEMLYMMMRFLERKLNI